MTHLFSHCPGPPDWRVPWEDLDEYPWVRNLAGCPQDPVFHAEGDVWVHTRMVCEALSALPAWRALPDEARTALFASAVLHDAGKPDCTRVEGDGRIRSRGHSRRGSILARTILWRMGTPFAAREQVAALVRYHQLPYFLVDRADARRLCAEVSLSARCDHLALLAEADVRGRVCADRQRLLDNVALFAEYAREQGCLATPYPFPSDHTRVLYFQSDNRPPDVRAHEEFRAEVVLMSGLPGSGKDHHVRAHLADRPVVSLDALRAELGVSPTDEQGAVLNEARERARGHLRRGQPFVWNATNLSRQIRTQPLQLFLAYQARVRVVYVEAPPDLLFAQNRRRASPVPEKVLENMLDRWEVPDLTEAHQVDYVVGP